MKRDCDKTETCYDGELAGAEAVAAAAHTSACPACGARIAELQAVDKALDPARAMAGADVSRAVMARIAELPARAAAHPFAGWWKVPAFALASCAVYALCAEAGLLPGYSAASLAAALRAERETAHFSSMMFGTSRAGRGEMLAMVLEGGKK